MRRLAVASIEQAGRCLQRALGAGWLGGHICNKRNSEATMRKDTRLHAKTSKQAYERERVRQPAMGRRGERSKMGMKHTRTERRSAAASSIVRALTIGLSNESAQRRKGRSGTFACVISRGSVGLQTARPLQKKKRRRSDKSAAQYLQQGAVRSPLEGNSICLLSSRRHWYKEKAERGPPAAARAGA